MSENVNSPQVLKSISIQVEMTSVSLYRKWIYPLWSICRPVLFRSGPDWHFKPSLGSEILTLKVSLSLVFTISIYFLHVMCSLSAGKRLHPFLPFSDGWDSETSEDSASNVRLRWQTQHLPPGAGKGPFCCLDLFKHISCRSHVRQWSCVCFRAWCPAWLLISLKIPCPTWSVCCRGTAWTVREHTSCA